MRLRTGRHDLVAYRPDADGVWNPMSSIFNTAQFKLLRFRIWVSSFNQLTVAPGIQYSEDALGWGAPHLIGSLVTPTSDGWLYLDGTYFDLWDASTGFLDRVEPHHTA